MAVGNTNYRLFSWKKKPARIGYPQKGFPLMINPWGVLPMDHGSPSFAASYDKDI